MERVLREKRCRHYLELWKQTDPEAEPERYQSYCDAFYAENLRIQELDRQRLYSITDLLLGWGSCSAIAYNSTVIDNTL